MLQRPIPSTGETIPALGLGTWKSFDVSDAESARRGPREVLDGFVKLGGRLVDSSPMYGRAERVVGDLAAELAIADRLFIATKVWTTGRREGIEEMRASMRNLRASPIDLMQVHNLLDVDVHLATLAGWKQQGLVRYVGVTHYTASAHADVARVLERHPVDFIQINYSVAEGEAERRLLPLAMERGIAVIANRPLASGALMRRLEGRPLPELSRDIDCDSWPQLLLKFVVSHPAVTCAIPATSSAAHLRDNMKAGLGRLPNEAERVAIARLAA
jgi:aryl-alcohol dehydrogenase-like predicted oxidoreductase